MRPPSFGLINKKKNCKMSLSCDQSFGLINQLVCITFFFFALVKGHDNHHDLEQLSNHPDSKKNRFVQCVSVRTLICV